MNFLFFTRLIQYYTLLELLKYNYLNFKLLKYKYSSGCLKYKMLGKFWIYNTFTEKKFGKKV